MHNHFRWCFSSCFSSCFSLHLKFVVLVCSELVPVQPSDWSPEPPGFLPQLQDARLRSWALQLHRLWPMLHRRMRPDVDTHPERHSMISLPHPFFMPGKDCRTKRWYTKIGMFTIISHQCIAAIHFPAHVIE